MISKAKDDDRGAADLLKILGQETRIRILERLRGGEHCVCDICPDIGEQSNVSRHLGILKMSGLIRDRRVGTRQFYRVVVPEVFPLIDAARAASSSGSSLTDADGPRD